MPDEGRDISYLSGKKASKVDNIFIIGVFERKKWHNMAFCLKLDGFNTKNEKSISANLRNFVKHRTMD